MLSSSLRIFSQHLIFHPKQWLLNGTGQFLLCKSPGTLPACNMSSVPPLKMCRDFDNHVKQTLSHSCVIRNSVENALVMLRSACPQVHPSSNYQSERSSNCSLLAALSNLSAMPLVLGVTDTLGSGDAFCEAPGVHRRLCTKVYPKAHKTIVSCLDASFLHSIFSLQKKSPGSMLPLACLEKFSSLSPLLSLPSPSSLVMVLLTLGKQ